MIGTVLAGLVCFVAGFWVSQKRIVVQVKRNGYFTIGSSVYRGYVSRTKKKVATPDAIEEAQQYRG